jgi:hypothetical protein
MEMAVLCIEVKEEYFLLPQLAPSIAPKNWDNQTEMAVVCSEGEGGILSSTTISAIYNPQKLRLSNRDGDGELQGEGGLLSLTTISAIYNPPNLRLSNRHGDGELQGEGGLPVLTFSYHN